MITRKENGDILIKFPPKAGPYEKKIITKAVRDFGFVIPEDNKISFRCMAQIVLDVSNSGLYSAPSALTNEMCRVLSFY